jgi:16S rRNA (guanine527-N7)-methyltransferase
MKSSIPPISARISVVAGACGLVLPKSTVFALSAWIELVQDWNKRMDLTAARSEDELIDLMLADALVLASHIRSGTRVVDVGSGAGAPGMPLAMLRGDLDVTLVEPQDKRVAFLRTTVGTVWGSKEAAGSTLLRRPQVLRERGEGLARRGLSFGVAISRATLAPAKWLELGAKLSPEGEVWVLLAREAPPVRAGWVASDDIGYRWPLTGAGRRAVRFVRQA